mgnify:CR=1 FL=1
MVRILGFNGNDDSGAALLEDGKIKYAVNEERLIRIKLYKGFPQKSINLILEENKLKPDDIDKVVVTGYPSKYPSIKDYLKKLAATSPLYYYYVAGRFKYMHNVIKTDFKETMSKARKLFPKSEIINVDHHLAHAASAHFTSGWEKNLIVTADGWGDRLSNGAYLGNGPKIRMIHGSHEMDSLGYFYGRLTVALGFKFHRHEGKVTGLAAYAKPTKRLMEIMKRMVYFDRKSMSFKSKIGKYYIPSSDVKPGFIRLFSSFKKEEVAASAQAWLETVFKEYMESLIDKNGASNVALSGGIFGNVKLNQRIHEVKGVKNIFIHPHMGDGGLGMGGALYIHNQERPMNVSLKDVYLGPEYSNKKIKKELDKSRLKYTYYKDPAGAAADLLAKGQIVARFDGRMEYGPRALGNRTIMYQTTDKSVNDWLNKDLKRTEFMPFAPVVLSKYAKKCFNNIKGAEYAAKFMTITFDCTEWMKKSCPGVVHLDNTARPQLIDRDANPGYFKILDEYRKLTGIPALINTSYNMHEEPIVCSPYDAIRAFKQGHLKNLLIENYIVNQK